MSITGLDNGSFELIDQSINYIKTTIEISDDQKCLINIPKIIIEKEYDLLFTTEERNVIHLIKKVSKTFCKPWRNL